jgi:hypothetical protein
MEGSAASQLEEFAKAARALADLAARKAARVMIGPGGFTALWEPPVGIRFEVSYQHAETASVLAQYALTRETFERWLGDIGEVLTAAVTEHSPDTLARNREREDARPSEPPEVTREKYRIVEQSFDVGALSARAWAKQNSKNDLPMGLSWETARKVQDSRAGAAPPAGGIYATLKIASGPSQHDIFFALSRRGYHELTLTVDREDVISFRDELNALIESFDNIDTTPPVEEPA